MKTENFIIFLRVELTISSSEIITTSLRRLIYYALVILSQKMRFLTNDVVPANELIAC